MGEKWIWWAGHKSSVDDDGTYDIDSAATREEVILSGLRDTLPGDQFYIIEALMGPWEDDGDPDSRHPFAEMRNRELLTNGPDHAR